MGEELGGFAPHILSSVDIAYRNGVRLDLGTDFAEFKQHALRQPDKSPLNPAFDIDDPAVSAFQGIWMLGFNGGGEIVHTQAIKTIDLTGTTLHEHLSQHTDAFGTHGFAHDPDRTEIHLSPRSAAITGLATYHGELWLKGGPNGIRGGALVAILTRLMLMIAIARWRPDYLIGLQSPMTACRGLPVREGYAHTEQRTLVWHQSNSQSTIEDWLVWMDLEEARFNLRIPPEFFTALLERKPAQSSKPDRMVA